MSEPRYGVYTNYYDNVSIRRSTIRGFQTGVQNLRSDIVVSDSVIKSNDFGIDNAYAGTEIIRSTITGNTKIGVEAGYYGDSDLRDSTVADNGGVGIFGDIELYNSTVTGNGGAAESYGGDVATFTNSIVIDNPRPDGMAECGEKAPKSKGGNVFGTDCDAHVTGEDVAVDDARLGPLRNNGGATPTVALHSGLTGDRPGDEQGHQEGPARGPAGQASGQRVLRADAQEPRLRLRHLAAPPRPGGQLSRPRATPTTPEAGAWPRGCRCSWRRPNSRCGRCCWPRPRTGSARPALRGRRSPPSGGRG